jgi:glycosyltransferase involved in cell wall biosynthesis
MSSALVSIVIPYYNKKDTIFRSVDSVIKQTYTNWELIIIDDCGEDKLEINSLPKDDRIRILFNELNLGAAQTRQRGIENSKGVYIAFLDADDWWGKRFLEVCTKKLLYIQDCAGCYVNIIEVKNGEEKKRSKRLGLSNILNTNIAYRRPWQTSGILWRKSVVGSWGVLKTHEDSWFEVMTSKNNNVLVYAEDEYCFYDQVGNNHLSSLTSTPDATLNQQKLFIMIYKEFWKCLDFKHKVILYHRLIRGQLKIFEYCPEFSSEMGNILMKLNPYLFWIRNQIFTMKVIRYFLKRSNYKIKF